jgi:hypothetical protein
MMVMMMMRMMMMMMMMMVRMIHDIIRHNRIKHEITKHQIKNNTTDHIHIHSHESKTEQNRSQDIQMRTDMKSLISIFASVSLAKAVYRYPYSLGGWHAGRVHTYMHANGKENIRR